MILEHWISESAHYCLERFTPLGSEHSGQTGTKSGRARAVQKHRLVILYVVANSFSASNFQYISEHKLLLGLAESS